MSDAPPRWRSGRRSSAECRAIRQAISFNICNINTPGVPVQRSAATVTLAGIVLEGGIWDQDVRQTGRQVTAARAAALAHREVPLPPLGTIAPDGLAATPPRGWSSWNRFADKIDDRTIRSMADALVSSGLRDAGYHYVNIDDGCRESGARAACCARMLSSRT